MKNIRKVAKKANCVSQMTSEWESSIVDFHLESCCFSKRKWSVCVLESKLLLLLSFLPCQLYWRYGWQTLCDLMDCGLPGSSDQVVLQARILEWVAVCFSRGSSQPRDQTCVSCTAGRFFTTEPPGKPFHVEWSVKVSQSCLTLCDPMDCTVHGIL